MAFEQNCDIEESKVNTGTDGNKAMGPTRMLIFGNIKKEFTPEQFAGGMLELLTDATAADGKDRIYVLFGENVPVRGINYTKGENKTETLPDGSMAFIQNGMITEIFMTKEGGECLAKILFAMNGSQLGFWKVDGDNNVKVRKLANGNYSFIPPNMIDSPLPDEATFDAAFKNYLRINHDPKYSLKESVIFKSSEDLSGLKGLIDAQLVVGPASTTTKLRFYVRDICCNTNLGIDYDTELPDVANFTVYNVTDSAAVVPSAAALVANNGNPYVELTVDAQTAADVLRVSATAASVWLANGLAYEVLNSIEITIPG